MMAKLDKLNGIFFCGGLADDKDYYNLAISIYNKAKEFNNRGVYYPVWGTCLGFYDMAMFEGGRDCLGEFDAHQQNDPIKFIVNPLESKLWRNLGERAYNFEKYNITYNSHAQGAGLDTFKTNQGLKDAFRPLSTAIDNAGKVYVSSMEGIKYPFYAV